MRIIAVVLLLTISMFGFADSVESLPTKYNKDSLWDSHGSINVRKINIAFQPGKKLEQKLAYIYIYGVVDSTEGVIWRNDATEPVGPGSIKELAVHALRRSLATDPDGRAATVIIKEFQKVSPCPK